MVKIDDKHVKQFQKYVKILLPNILLNDTILPVLEREKHNFNFFLKYESKEFHHRGEDLYSWNPPEATDSPVVTFTLPRLHGSNLGLLMSCS